MKIRPKRRRGTTLLLIALMAAGILLLLTVVAAQGQRLEPPPATSLPAGPSDRPTPLAPPGPPDVRPGPDTGQLGPAEQGEETPPNSAEAGHATRWAEPRSRRPANPSAAAPVLVIMDSYPWGSTGIQDVLDVYGIPYDQVNSSEIPTIDLSPYAVVIIPSDQPQSFYDTYDSNRGKFETYTAGGGVVEFHAAAWGWGGGSLSGIPLPGGVGVIQSYQNNNYVGELSPSTGDRCSKPNVG